MNKEGFTRLVIKFLLPVGTEEAVRVIKFKEDETGKDITSEFAEGTFTAFGNKGIVGEGCCWCSLGIGTLVLLFPTFRAAFIPK